MSPAPTKASLSAVIIAANEAAMIGPCLELLAFADEIVVIVDDRSTDQTEVIAKRHTPLVFRRHLDSFSNQKNFGLSKASGDWILWIDADERVTPALADEIRTAIADRPGIDRPAAGHAGYRIPRRDFLLGQELRHGGWGDLQTRLFQRQQGRYVGDVHERLELSGSVGQLRQSYWHFSHRNPSEPIAKTLYYAELWAEEAFRGGHPRVRKRSFLTVPARALWFRLVRHRGGRDGIPGMIEGVLHAFAQFYFYVILWQRQRQPSLAETYEALEAAVKKEK